MEKILLIEDESSIADNIRFALEKDGFNPIWCATGKEGVAALEEHAIALIVLDVGLPDANGFELCKQIRQASKVPIVFLTARSDEIDRIVGLELGADDYMVKPFSPRELIARIKAVLRRIHSQDGDSADGVSTKEKNKIQYGPFAIDMARYQIKFFNQSLELSRYEFRLLKVLIERPGRVLSRDQLMELAWDDPASSLDRTVDAHIKTLRAKLKKVNEGTEVIITHRGIGYSLSESLPK